MFKKYSLFALLLFLFCCSKKSTFTPIYDVSSGFQPYVDSFEHQAALHGIKLNINNLIIKYDPSMPANICGLSNMISAGNDAQKIISVNPNIKCWNNNQELLTLIFHEMGHCVLGRSHDNDLLPSGDPRSIMVENNLGLFSVCSYPIGEDPCNKTYREEYYIDELFNPSAPVPDWGK